MNIQFCLFHRLSHLKLSPRYTSDLMGVAVQVWRIEVNRWSVILAGDQVCICIALLSPFLWFSSSFNSWNRWQFSSLYGQQLAGSLKTILFCFLHYCVDISCVFTNEDIIGKSFPVWILKYRLYLEFGFSDDQGCTLYFFNLVLQEKRSSFTQIEVPFNSDTECRWYLPTVEFNCSWWGQTRITWGCASQSWLTSSREPATLPMRGLPVQDNQ